MYMMDKKKKEKEMSDKMAYGGKMMAEGGMSKESPLVFKDGYNPQRPQGFMKGGAVMGIIAKLKKKPEMESEESEMSAEEDGGMKAHMEGMKAAADEMMSAMKSGDSEAFATSLMNFIKLHGMGGESYEEE